VTIIPGTVGAAPVQNIGAYGVEVEQFITKVECFDLAEARLLELSKAECEFEYRDSLIKRAGQGRYLVTNVEFELTKIANPVLTYKPLKSFFEKSQEVSPLDVFKQVCRIRKEKLPDPKELPNAGSFFKNPIVSSSQYETLKSEYPDLIGFSIPSSEGNRYKLAAGWLIEKAGFKGREFGLIGIHKYQALVLVNYSDTNGANIWRLAQTIMSKIYDMFKIELEPEVRILGA